MAKLTIIMSELLTKDKYGPEKLEKIKNLISNNKDHNLILLDSTSPIKEAWTENGRREYLKDPGRVKKGVDEIIKKYPKDNAMLLGGPDLIPFHSIDSEYSSCINGQCTIKKVYSDLPYASSNPYNQEGKVENYIGNFRAVTRLPDVSFSQTYDSGGWEIKNYKPSQKEIDLAFENFEKVIQNAFSDTKIEIKKYKSDIFAYALKDYASLQKVKIEDTLYSDNYKKNLKVYSKSDGFKYDNIPSELYKKYAHIFLLHGNQSLRYFKHALTSHPEDLAFKTSYIYNDLNKYSFNKGMMALLNCCYSAQLNYIGSKSGQSNWEKNWTDNISMANIYMEYAKIFMGNTDEFIYNPLIPLSNVFQVFFEICLYNLPSNEEHNFGNAVCKTRQWLSDIAKQKSAHFDYARYYLAIFAFYGNPNYILTPE